MMTLEEAIQKAQKLMKLSQSSNAHEAALAAQRAQEILARYNIDSAALAVDANEDPSKNEKIEDFGDFESGGQRLASWKPMLANRIGRVNACKVYISGSNIGIIGRASDVAKVKMLFAVLAREVDRLTLSLARGKGRAYANSFRTGCVSGIGEKLEQAAEQVASDMRAEHAGNTAALVRIDKALARLADKSREVDLWVQMHKDFRNARRSYRSSSAGYAEGQAAGRSVNVSGSARGYLGTGQQKLRA